MPADGYTLIQTGVGQNAVAHGINSKSDHGVVRFDSMRVSSGPTPMKIAERMSASPEPGQRAAGGHRRMSASVAAVEAHIHRRRTVLPKRLAGPGPSQEDLARILDAAAAAPDHGQLVPWRFVLVPPASRDRLARAFEQALTQRDAAATSQQRAQAREKAFRSPTLLLAVARLNDGPAEIPDAERLLSLGCALQNMMLVATALGYGTSLTSGKAMDSSPLRELFGLVGSEQAVCFLSIGCTSVEPPAKNRPSSHQFFSILQPEHAAVPRCPDAPERCDFI